MKLQVSLYVNGRDTPPWLLGFMHVATTSMTSEDHEILQAQLTEGQDVMKLEWKHNLPHMDGVRRMVLRLLYHRKCLESETSEKRVELFKRALHYGDPSEPHTCLLLNTFQFQRIRDLVRRPLDSACSMYSEHQTWDNFTDLPGMSVWHNKLTSFVGFTRLFGSLVQRLSPWNGTYGNGVCGCFGHAEALTVHYSLWSHRFQEESGKQIRSATMPDLTWFMVMVADANWLWEYIRSGMCPMPEHVLEKLSGVTPTVLVADALNLTVALINACPVILCGVEVTKALLDPRRSRLSGTDAHLERVVDSEGCPRLHSMVIVGYRFDEEDGKPWFLVQNCFPKKQFLEVDIDYIRGCNARVLQLSEPFLTLPKGIPSTSEKCVVSSFVGVECARSSC